MSIVLIEDVPPSEDLNDPFAYQPSDRVIEDVPRPVLHFVQQLLRSTSEKNISARVKHVRVEDSSSEEDSDSERFLSVKRYGKSARVTDHMVPRVPTVNTIDPRLGERQARQVSPVSSCNGVQQQSMSL